MKKSVPRAVVVLRRLGVAAAALPHHLVVGDAGISGDGGVLLIRILPPAPKASRLGPLSRGPAIGGS